MQKLKFYEVPNVKFCQVFAAFGSEDLIIGISARRSESRFSDESDRINPQYLRGLGIPKSPFVYTKGLLAAP